MPYTLIYSPPGEKSSQSLTVSQTNTTTYGVSLTLGSGSIAGATYADETTVGVATPSSIKTPFGNIPLPTYSHTNSSAWSASTTEIQSHSTTTGVSYISAQINSSGAGNNAPYTKSGGEPVPSAAQSYYFTEPFWKDLLYLLVHPKIKVYNLSHCASGVMPPCNDGSGISPLIISVVDGSDVVSATAQVLDLYQCLAPGGSYPLPAEPEVDSAGNPIVDSNGNFVYSSKTGDTMTPYDCWQALQVDPFFIGVGQSAPLSAPKASEVDIYESTSRNGPGFGPAGDWKLSNAPIIGWGGQLANTQTLQTTAQDAAINSSLDKLAAPSGVCVLEPTRHAGRCERRGAVSDVWFVDEFLDLDADELLRYVSG